MFKRRKPRETWEVLREWLWPKSGWIRASKYVFHRLIRLDDGPRTIAVGMACGAFASASPFVGTHFITAGILALIFRGNVIASTLGTWVGNPVTFPFIWLLTYQIGLIALGREVTGEMPDIGSTFSDGLSGGLFSTVLYPMLVGALPVGSFLALVTYFPTLWAVKGYKLAKKKRYEHKNSMQQTKDKA
ncbi:MAG: DUF2062 domain-containing protein [Parvibaculales bacterium]